jgi:N-acetylmuramoyl-L-alanine amidase
MRPTPWLEPFHVENLRGIGPGGLVVDFPRPIWVLFLFMRYLSLTVVLVICCSVLPASPRGAEAAARHQAASPQTVVIDPGHGGSESGAVDASGQLLEKNLTLQVAKKAASYLKGMGYRVYLTRTHDGVVNTPARDLNHDGKIDHVDEIEARNLFANSHHADVFVSIHFDGSTDPTVRGTHGYYCPARPFWRQSEVLANLLTTSVASAVQRSGYADLDKGVKTDVADVVPQSRADYPWFLVLGPSRKHWLTGTGMPGALMESMYLSSPRDAAALQRPSTITAIAKGYATGIRAYLLQTAH